MSVRGIRQLKSIRLYFCDFGGSSKGTRELLKSDSIVDFMKKSKLDLHIAMRRGRHPYISSTYINGYVKDQSLRNYTQDEVLEEFDKMYSGMGRKSLKHATYEVSKGR